MKGCKGVIFDFNGTLFFDNDKHIKAWNAVSMKLRNKEITEEELHEKFNGTPNDQIIRYMTDGKASEDEIKKYSLLKEEYYRKFCQEDQDSFHLVAGVKDYFAKLKQKRVPFTIASASIKENIDFFRKSFGLDYWIVTSSIVYDDGTYENKVEMFQDAAKIIGIPMEDILVYEDSFSGIRNAYEAGCRNIIVICEKEKEEEYRNLPGVIKTMQTFQDL